MKILDIGCGNEKAVGAVGIDKNPGTQADVIHDLNQYPWPFESGTFDRIICNHIVEHIVDLIKFMEEVHRICRPDALIEIITPHFSSTYSYTDPTHVRHLGRRSFDYFMARRPLSKNIITRFFETQFIVPDFYLKPLFCPVNIKMTFSRPYRIIGIQWLANRCPDFYEFYMTWIFPARNLRFVLKVLK